MKLFSRVRVLPHHRPRRGAPLTGIVRPLETVPAVIGIGASTGGPAALETILTARPAGAAPPVVIVQHTGEAFARSLATWLSEAAGRPVRLAEHDLLLRPFDIVLAPPGLELTLTAALRVRLQPGAPGALHVPSVDGLFHSLATSFGAAALGVLLTGMGRDGAEGLLAMRARGATTVAQDRSSAVLYGMPRAAAELGAASHILTLPEIARLVASAGGPPRHRPSS